MSYVEITWLTGFKLLTTSYIFPHFYVVPPLPFCNYLDTVTILIRRMIQSIVDSFPKLLRAVAASASVWEQAACSSLSSDQQSYEHLHEMTTLLGTSGVAEPQGLFTDPLPSHRESISRQVFKSGCPLGEKDLEFSRRKKAKRFPPPPYISEDYITIIYPVWGQSQEKKKILANRVVLQCKLLEWI